MQHNLQYYYNIDHIYVAAATIADSFSLQSSSAKIISFFTISGRIYSIATASFVFFCPIPEKCLHTLNSNSATTNGPSMFGNTVQTDRFRLLLLFNFFRISRVFMCVFSCLYKFMYATSRSIRSALLLLLLRQLLLLLLSFGWFHIEIVHIDLFVHNRERLYVLLPVSLFLCMCSALFYRINFVCVFLHNILCKQRLHYVHVERCRILHLILYSIYINIAKNI